MNLKSLIDPLNCNVYISDDFPVYISILVLKIVNTFHYQCDGSRHNRNVIRSITDVNTSIGRRGSRNSDALLAPPGGHGHVRFRTVPPLDVRGRMAISTAAESHVVTQEHVHLLAVTLSEDRGVCGETGDNQKKEGMI